MCKQGNFLPSLYLNSQQKDDIGILWREAACTGASIQLSAVLLWDLCI